MPDDSRKGTSGTAAPIVKAMNDPTAAAMGEPIERLSRPTSSKMSIRAA